MVMQENQLKSIYDQNELFLISGEDKDVHTAEDLIAVASNAGMTDKEVLVCLLRQELFT